MDEVIKIKQCSNCDRYICEIYREYPTNKLVKTASGFCHRTKRPSRKSPEHSCNYYKIRVTEPGDEILYRRQQLYAEIEACTECLKKIKCLADLAAQIKELFPEKE